LMIHTRNVVFFSYISWYLFVLGKNLKIGKFEFEK
jgi:hypothetical protein